MGTGAVWIRLTHPGDGVRNHRANNPRNGSRKFNPPGSKVVLYSMDAEDEEDKEQRLTCTYVSPENT